jgi:hypothetical protein
MATQKDLKERSIKNLLDPEPRMTEDEENEFIAEIANWLSMGMNQAPSPFAYLKTMLEFIGYVSLYSFDPQFEYSFASRKWFEGGFGVGMISH